MDFKVADLSLAEYGRKEIDLAEHEMPGLMAMRRALRQGQAARRSPHRRLAAHDDPDGGADRDARRARRRRPLGHLQHLLDPGPRRRRGRRRRRRHRRRPPGHAGLRLEGRDAGRVLGRGREGLRLRRRASGPNMLLDDGGDITMLLHLGVEFEKTGVVPVAGQHRQRGVQGGAARARPLASRTSRSTGPTSPRTSRASPRRPPPASCACTTASARARCSSRRSTSTTRSPRASSTTSTAAATR